MRRFLPLLLSLLLLAAAAPRAEAVRAYQALSVAVYDYANDCAAAPRTLPIVSLRLNGEAIAGEMPAVMLGGRTLAPLRLVCEALGVKVDWQADAAAQVRLTRGEDVIELTLGSPSAVVNGQVQPLPDGVPATLMTFQGQGYTMVPLRFFSETLGCQVSWDRGSCTASVYESAYIQPLLAPLDTPIEPERYLIVLDAGHGGSASGASYGGVDEKTLDLAMTQKLRDILDALGYHTVMTRDEDEAVGLQERAELANWVGADLFISIHCNAAEKDSQFQGLYVYHYPGSASAAALAQSIQTPACAFTGAVDRGINSDDFAVLRETAMPAVLVETGFMTCPEELARLVDDAYQSRMAQGIAQGVVRYLNAQNSM